ncbi:MAG: hypothetical protein R3A79_15220 [Nannocystaceae bacterium]
MGWGSAALLVLGIALLVVVVRRARYYARLLAPEHLRELHAAFVDLMDSVPVSDGPAAAPATDAARDCSRVSSQGLALVVTRHRSDAAAVLHVSISQRDRPTTQAVASRVAFIILAALARNPAELSPFYTASRVFHLVFVYADADRAFELRSADEVLGEYMTRYKPVPFAYRELPAA